MAYVLDAVWVWMVCVGGDGLGADIAGSLLLLVEGCAVVMPTVDDAAWLALSLFGRLPVGDDDSIVENDSGGPIRGV